MNTTTNYYGLTAIVMKYLITITGESTVFFGAISSAPFLSLTIVIDDCMLYE